MTNVLSTQNTSAAISNPVETEPMNGSDLRRQWTRATGGSYQIDLQVMGDTEKDRFCTSRYVLKPAFAGFEDDDGLKRMWLNAVGRRRKNDRFGAWRNSKNAKSNWRKIPRLKMNGPTLLPRLIHIIKGNWKRKHWQ